MSPYFSKVLLTLKFPNELCKHGCLHCGLQIEVRENFVTLNDSLFCPKFYPNLTESYPDISALGYSPEITRRVRRHSATMCGSHPMFVNSFYTYIYIPLYIYILYICPMFFYSFFLTLSMSFCHALSLVTLLLLFTFLLDEILVEKATIFHPP